MCDELAFVKCDACLAPLTPNVLPGFHPKPVRILWPKRSSERLHDVLFGSLESLLRLLEVS